jgi:hypothetical protein
MRDTYVATGIAKLKKNHKPLTIWNTFKEWGFWNPHSFLLGVENGIPAGNSLAESCTLEQFSPLYTDASSSSVNDHPKEQTAQMSFNRWVD